MVGVGCLQLDTTLPVLLMKISSKLVLVLLMIAIAHIWLRRKLSPLTMELVRPLKVIRIGRPG